MGSDLTVKNSHNKTVSRLTKQKDAKVAFDFTKPITFFGRNREGHPISYEYNPKGVLNICNWREGSCLKVEDTDKNGKFDTVTASVINDSTNEFEITRQEKLDESDRKNDVATYARNSLEILEQQKREYILSKIKINGKLGNFKQQGTGNCGLLAGTLSIDFASDGTKIIERSVSQEQNGDVKVNLEGVNTSFNVSPQEIYDASWELSKNSDVMRAIELGIRKYVSSSAERILRLSKKYPGKFDDMSIQKTFKDPTEGISQSTVCKILSRGSAMESNSYNWDLKIDPDDPFQPPIFEKRDPLQDPSIADAARQANEKTKFILDAKMVDSDRFGLSASIITRKQGPYSHAIAIKSVDENDIVYVDPHDSSKTIKVSRNKFMQDYSGVTICDLRSRRSKEEDAFARE